MLDLPSRTNAEHNSGPQGCVPRAGRAFGTQFPGAIYRCGFERAHARPAPSPGQNPHSSTRFGLHFCPPPSPNMT